MVFFVFDLLKFPSLLISSEPRREFYIHFSKGGAFTLRTISILNVVLCLKRVDTILQHSEFSSFEQISFNVLTEEKK